jgi:hypothetical protein
MKGMKGVYSIHVIDGIEYLVVEHQYAPKEYMNILYNVYHDSCSKVCRNMIRHARLIMSYEMADITLFAMKDSAIMGFANIEFRGYTMHIDILCTHQYIGSKMLQLLHDRVAPIFDCRLMTVLAIPRTIPFYVKNGFVRSAKGITAEHTPYDLKTWRKHKLHPQENEDNGFLMAKRVIVRT